MKKYRVFILILLLLFTVTCHAHPGRTDKYGGHTDKSTGEYHYHNADGTTTPASKPTEPEVQPEQKEPEAVISTVPDNVTTIIVDGDKKPVQQSVKDVIQENKPKVDEKPAKIEEIITVTDEKGETFIYIPQTQPYSNVNISVIVILLVLAITGWCAISPIMCILFKKIEEKNASLGIFLHIPYLLFWPGSLIGVLLYKLYNKIASREKDVSNEYDDDFDDDDDYEI